MNTKQGNKEAGVVLLEAIIAIGVLVAMVTGSLLLLSSSSRSVRSANDRLIATYLAQDAVEWIRARWYYNRQFVGGSGWLTHIQCPTGRTCGLETQTDVIVPTTGISECTLLNNCILRQPDPTSPQYSHFDPVSAAVDTPYTRTIVVQTADVDGDGTHDEAEYTVTVSWSSGSGTDSVEILTTLYND